MIRIGIDPSITSTGMVIRTDEAVLLFNYNNKKENYKWFKNTNNMINYKHYEKFSKDKSYSENEINKTNMYDNITNDIVYDIEMSLDVLDEPAEIIIEGYSYSSTGNIIDLVNFSSILRVKLSNLPNCTLKILSPSEAKKMAGMLVYDLDEKYAIRNCEGKAAGKFDKQDMLDIIYKLNHNNDYVNYLKNNKDYFKSIKNLPKPFDDINDAYLMCFV